MSWKCAQALILTQEKESGNDAMDCYKTQENSIKSNIGFDTTIYRMSAEEIRWGVVSPGSEWSIPLFRADFLCFTSKSVEVWPNLLAGTWAEG